FTPGDGVAAPLTPFKPLTSVPQPHTATGPRRRENASFHARGAIPPRGTALAFSASEREPPARRAEAIMYHSLLVPLDGFPFGEHALPLALTLARRCGAELHLVHAVAPLAAIYSETPLFVDDDLEKRLREHQR